MCVCVCVCARARARACVLVCVSAVGSKVVARVKVSKVKRMHGATMAHMTTSVFIGNSGGVGKEKGGSGREGGAHSGGETQVIDGQAMCQFPMGDVEK